MLQRLRNTNRLQNLSVIRWNLRIKGMKEPADENAQKEVVELLGNIAPHLAQKLEDVSDSVGRKESGRHRQMIVQFTVRRYRDEIWKTTKSLHVCIDRGIRSTEDLSDDDRRVRAALWPLIQEARSRVRRHVTEILWDTSTSI